MKAIKFALSVLALSASTMAQSVNDSALVVERVSPLDGLSQPTGMAFIGPNDILVNTKAGVVRRVTNGIVASEPVLTLPVNTTSERGLLGIVLHPDFANNSYVYLFHTAAGNPGRHSDCKPREPIHVERIHSDQRTRGKGFTGNAWPQS